MTLHERREWLAPILLRAMQHYLEVHKLALKADGETELYALRAAPTAAGDQLFVDLIGRCLDEARESATAAVRATDTALVELSKRLVQEHGPNPIAAVQKGSIRKPKSIASKWADKYTGRIAAWEATLDLDGRPYAVQMHWSYCATDGGLFTMRWRVVNAADGMELTVGTSDDVPWLLEMPPQRVMTGAASSVNDGAAIAAAVETLSSEERRAMWSFIRSKRVRRVVIQVLKLLGAMLLIATCTYIGRRIFVRLHGAPGTSDGTIPASMRPSDPPTIVVEGLEIRPRGARSLLLTDTQVHNDAWSGRRASAMRYFWEITERPASGEPPKVTKLQSQYPQVLYTSPFSAITGTVSVRAGHQHLLTAQYTSRPGDQVLFDCCDQVFAPPPQHGAFTLGMASDHSPLPQVILAQPHDIRYTALIIAVPQGWDSRKVHGEIRIPGSAGSTQSFTTPYGYFVLAYGARFPQYGRYPILVRTNDAGPLQYTGVEVIVEPTGFADLSCKCPVGVAPDNSFAWADLRTSSDTFSRTTHK